MKKVRWKFEEEKQAIKKAIESVDIIELIKIIKNNPEDQAINVFTVEIKGCKAIVLQTLFRFFYIEIVDKNLFEENKANFDELLSLISKKVDVFIIKQALEDAQKELIDVWYDGFPPEIMEHFEEILDNADDSSTCALDNGINNLSQRSTSPFESTENKEQQQEQQVKQEQTSKKDDIFHTVLDHLLSWLESLPEWIQQIIRNTDPVKALVESTEQISEVYNHAFKTEIFIAEDNSQQKDNSTDPNAYGKAEISYKDSLDAIDMEMISQEQVVRGYILPINIESNMIAGEIAFNQLGHHPIYY